jgi:hypothetical protein
MCYSSDRLDEIMYKAYNLGVQNLVFDKVAELSMEIKVYDTHSRAQVYEKAFNIVTNGNSKQSRDNSLTE